MKFTIVAPLCFINDMATRIIAIVSLLEGFATLAIEVLAIRMATPIVGSSIILTSVFLGIILLGLSAGYYLGGIISAKLTQSQRIRYLAGSLFFSGLYYILITFPYEVPLIEWLLTATNNYILTLFLVAIALFLLPVLIESQSIPLLTELINEKSKGKAAGKILFISTIGSFLGSVLPAILLFETIGVQITSLVVGSLLFISAGLLLIKRKPVLARLIRGFSVVLFWILLTFHSAFKLPENFIYAFDSAYQEIRITESMGQGAPLRFFLTNRAYASGIFTQTLESPFSYVREAVQHAKDIQPKTVLVIGTAGFTFPYEVAQLPSVELIDTIDVDPRVKTIAEEYFLETKLPSSIHFYAQSARYFVNQAVKEGKKYDLILIDAYNGKSIPDELTTVEFFTDIKNISSNEKSLVINMIHDTSKQSDFSKNLYTTLVHVFDNIYTKNVSQNRDQLFDNFIITTYPKNVAYHSVENEGNIYTDDKRTTELDLVKMRRF